MLYMYSIVYAVFPLMHISAKFTHNKIIFYQKKKTNPVGHHDVQKPPKIY